MKQYLVIFCWVRHWSSGRGSLNTSRFLELFHHCPLRCLGDTLALLLFIFWCDQGCTYSRMSYQNNYIFQHVSPWKHLTRSQEEVQSLISYLEPWSVYRINISLNYCNANLSVMFSFYRRSQDLEEEQGNIINYILS